MKTNLEPNESWRKQRAAIRKFREYREAGLVRANFFIDNPRTLARVRIWLTVNEAYAKKCIQETAGNRLSEDDLKRIIQVAKGDGLRSGSRT